MPSAACVAPQLLRIVLGDGMGWDGGRAERVAVAQVPDSERLLSADTADTTDTWEEKEDAKPANASGRAWGWVI